MSASFELDLPGLTLIEQLASVKSRPQLAEVLHRIAQHYDLPVTDFVALTPESVSALLDAITYEMGRSDARRMLDIDNPDGKRPAQLGPEDMAHLWAWVRVYRKTREDRPTPMEEQTWNQYTRGVWSEVCQCYVGTQLPVEAREMGGEEAKTMDYDGLILLQTQVSYLRSQVKDWESRGVKKPEEWAAFAGASAQYAQLCDEVRRVAEETRMQLILARMEAGEQAEEAALHSEFSLRDKYQILLRDVERAGASGGPRNHAKSHYAAFLRAVAHGPIRQSRITQLVLRRTAGGSAK